VVLVSTRGSALWGRGTVVESACTVLVLSVMLGAVGDGQPAITPTEN